MTPGFGNQCSTTELFSLMKNFLIEIKNRILLIIFVWLYSLIICYYYKEILYFFLINKLTLEKNNFYFIYNNVTELFLVYFQLIQFFSVQIVFLLGFYNFFTFLVPALYRTEFFFLKKLLILLIINWFVNFLIILFVIFPLTWGFFEGFQGLFLTNSVYFEIKISEYFEFFKKIFIFIEFYFSIILIIIFLLKDFYYDKVYTKKFRKVNYFLFSLLFTLLNPFDIISQIILCFFLFGFYEISVFLHFLKNSKTFVDSNNSKIKLKYVSCVMSGI